MTATATMPLGIARPLVACAAATSSGRSSNCPGCTFESVTSELMSGVIEVSALAGTDVAGSVSVPSSPCCWASAAEVPDGMRLFAISTVTGFWPASARALAWLT